MNKTGNSYNMRSIDYNRIKQTMENPLTPLAPKNSVETIVKEVAFSTATLMISPPLALGASLMKAMYY